MNDLKTAKRAARKPWDPVAPGVWAYLDTLVNIYMVHLPHDNSWVLVDAGLSWSGPKIRQMAADLFWPNIQPKAIVLTHGHFDHVGAVEELAREWGVPVYAHYMEAPYLTGQAHYPPPDPTVGGGLLAYSGWMFPTSPIDISEYFQPLPEDGTLPGMQGWRYIHTPGHAPGHISLWREQDRVLLAGDAFVTTRQESLLAVAFQKEIMSGPPKYFTYDWDAAADSVRELAALEPDVAATGHGPAMYGQALRDALHELASQFEKLAVPSCGRYVEDPAVANEQGFTYIPPFEFPYRAALKWAGVALGAALLVWGASAARKNKRWGLG